MADEFTVKILSPEDFNKLPFKRIQDNPDSVFGAAEMSTKTAYVKDTGFNDLTKANIGHELDELMAATSPHEEDGIRYKDFSQSFSNFGSSIPVIGKAAGPLLGAVGGAGDLLGSGVSALGSGIKNIFSGSTGGQTTVPGPQGGTIKGTAQGPTPTALPAITGGAGSAATFAAQQAGNIIPQGGSQPSGGGFGDILKNIFSGGGATAGGGGGGGATPIQSTIPAAQNTGSFAGDIFQKLQENPDLAGSLIAGIGDLFKGRQDPVDVSGITGDLRNRVTGDGGAGSPVAAAASQELLGNLGSTPGAPPDSAFSAGDRVIEEDLTDQIKTLEQKFKAATGSADVSNNSAFLAEVSRLEERAREQRAAIRDEISFQFTREQLTRDLQEVELGLNLDKSQTEQLIQLAQLDAEALAFNYGLDLREAAEFKQLFGDFGQLLSTPVPAGESSDFNREVDPGLLEAGFTGIEDAALDTELNEVGRQGVIDAGIDINTVPPSGQFKLIHPTTG